MTPAWMIACLIWLMAIPGMAAAGGDRSAHVVAASKARADALTGTAGDYDRLLAAIGDARIVMLGEATHGSREFHHERARITLRLIGEKGFTAIVFEAPWEPSRRLDAYIGGGEQGLEVAFAGLGAFPRWMWRNSDVRDFVAGLREVNRLRPVAQRVRLFGMDLYSLPESADAVVRHVARRSIEAAALARRRYACFDDYRSEPQLYGRDVAAGRVASCAQGAQDQLDEMSAGGDEDEFAAWQSARVVRNAEDYYRAMYRSDISSWNVRERHLADTLDQLLDRLGPDGRMVVWAQNIHQGDARATDQAAVGETSIGQLMRERHGDAVVLVGFSTHRGQVRAAGGWGRPDRVWRLKPALPGSWADLLHQTGLPAFSLVFRGDSELAAAFAAPRLDRAVGVSYEPHRERQSHYFNTRLSQQFDAVIHIDVTRAVEPLP